MDSHPLSVLRHRHATLFRLYVEAERLATQAAEAACVRLRVFAETIVGESCALEHLARPRGIADGLNALRRATVPRDVRRGLETLRVLGNRAAHPSPTQTRMNPSSAVSALAAAHAVGCWLAVTHLGASSAEVNRFEPPPPSASQQVYQDAAHGDHEAQYQVGALLLHGADEYINGQLRQSGIAFLDQHHNAIEWLRKAQHAVPAARTKLALLVWRGFLPPRYPEEPVDLLESAADADDPDANAALGHARLFGTGGLTVDYGAARRHFEAAADHDHLEALNGLVKLYADGLGIPADAARALEYARRAAEGGYPVAQYNLALLIAKQGAGGPDRTAEVLAWLTRSAEGGNPQAMHDLYRAYRDGNGVAADQAQANRWRAAALEHDEPRTCFDMGLVLETGDGTAPDTLAALRFYERALLHAPEHLRSLADDAKTKMRLMVLRNREELHSRPASFSTDEFNDRIITELGTDDDGAPVPGFTESLANALVGTDGSPAAILQAMAQVNPSAARRFQFPIAGSRGQ